MRTAAYSSAMALACFAMGYLLQGNMMLAFLLSLLAGVGGALTEAGK